MSEIFFVGIRDPIEIRKELLTSSKNLIDSLKRYEKYKLIRETKTEHIVELKRVFDELLVLNKKLRGKLPKVPIKAPQLGETRIEQKKVKAAVKEMPKSKLDILEQELSKIEERLGSLD
jgi:hypothetical protein